MPSLGSKWIKVFPSDGGGRPFEFKTEISVDKEGVFRLTIPEEMYTTAQQFVVRSSDKHVAILKLTKNYCITANTRDGGLAFLKELAKEYIRCEVIRETVIVYRTHANLTYYRLHDGTIVPNGAYDPNSPKSGDWGGKAGESFGFSDGPRFTIGLVAAVYTKITARRSSGDQVSWERAGENWHSEPDNYLDKLNSFVRTGISEHDLDGMQQVPYTEEAAKFFYEAMLAMCKLSDRIESFFGNTRNVVEAIEARAAFRLGNGVSTALVASDTEKSSS